MTLDPYKITTFHYSGERHFNWRYPVRPGARIYLSARVVGRRRPITLFVYRQNAWEPGWLRPQLVRLGIPYRPHRLYLDEFKSPGLHLLDTEPAPSAIEDPASRV